MAKEILKEIGLSIKDFRFEKSKKIMGKNLDGLSSEELDYVKSFFLEFEKEIIDVKNPKDVAILYCRVHNEIEANFVLTGKYDVKKNKQEIFAKIINDPNVDDTANVNTYLLEIKKPESLTDEQIAFIKSFLVL